MLYKKGSEKIAEDLMHAVVHTTGFKQMVMVKEKKEKALEAGNGDYRNVELD